MQTEYRILEDKRGELSVEFSEEEFQQAMKQAYEKDANQFNVPGFRKGKAPMGVALRMYGESVLYDDAIDLILKDELRSFVDEYDIDLVASPEMELDEIGYHKGLKLRLLYTLKPEVELGEYKGVSVYAEPAEVKDEDVERRLNRIQEENARWVPVDDRPIEEGDRVNLDYQGYHNGELFDGGSAENHDLEIGSNSFIEGFEEGLIGLEVGDEEDLNLTFPEEYHADDLAGEDVVFHVKINSIHEKELPELDDDFAMDVSEFDTFDEYREDIKNQMMEEAKTHRQRILDQDILTKVVDNATIDIPQVMIDEEINQELYHQEMQMRQYGLNFQQFLQMTGQSIQDVRNQMMPDAERNVRTGLVLDAIFDAEGMEISEDEKKEAIEELASNYGMTAETLMSQLGGEDPEFLTLDLKRKKSMDFLREHAVELDEPPVEEEIEVKEDDEAEEAADAEAEKADDEASGDDSED